MSYELDRESCCQRVGVKTSDNISFVQLVQERHRDVTDMLVSETDLRSQTRLMREVQLAGSRTDK